MHSRGAVAAKTMKTARLYVVSQGVDLALQGHPYRNVLDLRHGASTSLIELEFASHTGKDSDTDPGVPEGLPFYTLKAQLRELELVFLNRFMQVWSCS